MVFAPLAGLAIISLGTGFLASLTTIRMDTAGYSELAVGIVSSAYYLGLAVGALLNDRLILRVGHIRSYSVFASIVAATALSQSLLDGAVAWFVLRLLCGWAAVGVFLIVESWLLLAVEQKYRGRTLAFYMIALYGSTMLAQWQLGRIDAWGMLEPFILAGILSSLSILPIMVIPRTSPALERIDPLGPVQLMRVSPSGVVGCFGSGILIAAMYSLLPLYLQDNGADVETVGQMSAMVILGAMILQYPVGRWSDATDRQIVMISLTAVCVIVSAALTFMPTTGVLSMALFFVLGGVIFSLYPVAVSYTVDNSASDGLVPMIQGLLLINSVGSAIGPAGISPAMSINTHGGLFLCIIALNVAMFLFFAWRRFVSQKVIPAPSAPFVPAGHTITPVGAELRVSEEMEQAVQDAAGDGDPEASAAPGSFAG